MLWKTDGKTDKAVADNLSISVNTIRRCVERYLSNGLNLALFDDECSGHTDDAKPWLQKYLKSIGIKPFKIKYYIERKDPDVENIFKIYKKSFLDTSVSK